MRITVLGTGYVGLVAGAALSEYGSDVTCVDIDAEKVRLLREGKIPIYEPGLDTLVQRNVAEGRLHFTTELQTAVADVDICIIAVGTPPKPDGSADLSHVWSAARTIGQHATGYTVVVTKSTVPVGTAAQVRVILNKFSSNKEFGVVSNPEFLKEGDAVNDFMKPARVIIGTNDPRAEKVMRYLYGAFVRTQDRILVMDPASAEITKYACNAMLATRISFMNEMATLCSKVGADVEQVRLGMGWDNRIGARFLFPGVGYGGSCFPKDVKAIISTAKEHELSLHILQAVEDVNERQKQLLANMVLQRFSGSEKGRTAAIWGLSFKPNTDDVREAPAQTICNRLLEKGFSLRLFDPVASEAFAKQLPASEHVKYCANNYEAAQGADALLLVTEWPTFRRPDFRRLKDVMKTPALFDGRNIWEAQIVREMGFEYRAIGRP